MKLKRVILNFREDGRIDVTRERAEHGETIKGCASLQEAFDAVAAHDDQRGGVTKENDMRCTHCGNDICDPCWRARADRLARVVALVDTFRQHAWRHPDLRDAIDDYDSATASEGASSLDTTERAFMKRG